MKNTLAYALFFIMAFIIAILSILLFSSKSTIKHQDLIISEQNQKISQLESQVAKLSEATPENILRMTGNLAKEKGINAIKNILSK